MAITVAELKKNLNEYIELAEREQISISDGNKIIAVLTSPDRDVLERTETAKSLFGILPNNANLEKAKEERLSAI